MVLWIFHYFCSLSSKFNNSIQMNIQYDNQHIIYKQKRMFNGHLNLRIQQKKNKVFFRLKIILLTLKNTLVLFPLKRQKWIVCCIFSFSFYIQIISITFRLQKKTVIWCSKLEWNNATNLQQLWFLFKKKECLYEKVRGKSSTLSFDQIQSHIEYRDDYCSYNSANVYRTILLTL